MLWTTIPATIVGMIVWFVVGLGFEPDSTSGDSVGGLTAELSSIFNWNIFMLLPFVIILWGAFAKNLLFQSCSCLQSLRSYWSIF